MLVNNEVYDIDLSQNLFAYKMKQVMPINISFTPFIESRDGDLFHISDMFAIVDEEGYDYLTENFRPLLGFSLFKPNILETVEDLFLGDKNLYISEFMAPALTELLEIIDERDVIRSSVNSACFYEICSEDGVNEFIDIMNSTIDRLFEKFNNHIKEVEEWLELRYEEMGMIFQSNYTFSHISEPDLLLDFDGKFCGIFRTKLATTYFLPNGL